MIIAILSCCMNHTIKSKNRNKKWYFLPIFYSYATENPEFWMLRT